MCLLREMLRLWVKVVLIILGVAIGVSVPILSLLLLWRSAHYVWFSIEAGFIVSVLITFFVWVNGDL